MSDRFTNAVTHPASFPWRATKRGAMVILPLVALATLLGACGGSSKSAATASPTTTTPSRSGAASAAFAKYTQCLESHGVPASTASSLFGGRRSGSGSSTSTPSGSAPAGGFTRPTIPAQYQAAFTACASDRPSFGGFGGGGFNSTALTNYRNCLEVHGVKLPTPPTTTPGETRPTGGSGNGFGSVLGTPAGKAAAQACASLLPARTGSSSSTTAG
jgi:hypothetical protein